MWIGLAARDSLRLEAGLCLHGQDITPDIDPASAGLMWAIPKALRADGRLHRRRGAARHRWRAARREKRVGLKPEGRQPVRAGAPLFDDDGKPAGRVTSGGFGPSAGHPVAMGYVAAALGQARAHGSSPMSAARRSRSTSTPCPSRPTATAKDKVPWHTTYFTEDHEWIRVEGGIATVGITDYAQEQLGDLVFVELPEAGRKAEARATSPSSSNRSRRRPTSMRRPMARSPRRTPRSASDPALVNSAADRRRLAVEDEARRREPA